ncbi:hypothetical protein Rvan_3293 [Rhodomicrobium vannielii ATCC 17100]|uniref:Uncharacterized protein n=1 Tax=Rhodomicrobium vannielii (strain ATCC 17100 / DSM 162 / LMG 4299 / NCIMB 10020 / ATH 3.1.1) TaxID=648757 RepID=E3I293_RHOVT|nr:hypothetical protein Rvan_3293 [Rhodomicrobium vannielii ATCC 17100]
MALSKIGVPERQQPFIGIGKILVENLECRGDGADGRAHAALRVTSPGVMGRQETFPVGIGLVRNQGLSGIQLCIRDLVWVGPTNGPNGSG